MIGSRFTDWSHPDDYAPEGVRWEDITHVGSQYQIQMDLSSAFPGRPSGYRHRYLAPGSPWVAGEPPKEKS